VRVNDLKVFQRNPLKPFWTPLPIQREFDAYVRSHGLMRYDLPDPTSKPSCRAVIECTQASSSEYHGNPFSYVGHLHLLNPIVQRIGNRHRRRKAKKGVRTPCVPATTVAAGETWRHGAYRETANAWRRTRGRPVACGFNPTMLVDVPSVS